MAENNNFFVPFLEKIRVLNRLNEEIKRNIKFLYVFKNYYKEINVILVTNEDKVYCVGKNSRGVLGFGHQNSIEVFTINEELSNKEIIDFENSLYQTIARTRDGKLYSWGCNKRGLLGNGIKDSEIHKPQLNQYLINENIVDVCCAFRHTLVLTSNGEVYAWGENVLGQIGIRSEDSEVLTPIKVNEFNGEKVTRISCGSNHSIALTESGNVFGWGDNEWGQLGSDDGQQSENKPKHIQIDVIIEKISCGFSHSLLLSCDGDIYVFGANNCSQLGLLTYREKQPTPVKLNHINKFIQIASHFWYNISAALSDNGLYYVWGECEDENISSEPKETQFKSFNDIFLCCLQITYKTLDFSDEKIKSEQNIPNNIENESQFRYVFTKKELIGTGSFGQVYKVFHPIEQQYYAMKKFTFQGFSDEMKEQGLKELKVLTKLRSDYILNHKTSWIENNSICFVVMELCYNTLEKVLKQKRNEFKRKRFETMTPIEYYISSELFKEILEGINYLHKLDPPVFHKDLKPTNIMITYGTDGRFAKITDFGLGTNHIFDEMTRTHGLESYRYVAPEVIRGRKSDSKSDIYSLGVNTQELFDIDINAFTNHPIENPLIKDKYETIFESISEMMSPDKKRRHDCEHLLKIKSSWHLDINAIQSDLTHHNLTQLSINEQSMERSFYKFFIMTKLMYK